MKKLLFAVLVMTLVSCDKKETSTPEKATKEDVSQIRKFDNVAYAKQMATADAWDECDTLDYYPIDDTNDMFFTFLGIKCFPRAPYANTKILGWNPNSTRITSMGKGTGIDIVGGNLVNTSPNINQTLSQVGNTVTLSNGGGSFNLPSSTSRIFNNNVSRSLNSNFTISTTRDAQVSYSISLSCTNPLLAGSSTANAFLEYSTDSGTTWITVSDISNASSVALAVTIALTQPNKFVLSGMIPSNALVRIRTTTSGTASATFGRAQEVLI